MKTSMALSFLDLRRYRWLPHLLIAMTVFAVLAGIVLIRFVDNRFVEVTGGELALAAEEVAEKLDRMLFERQGDALMMARALALRISDPRYLSEYLKWVKKEHSPVYLSLAIMDVQGTVVAATEPALVGRDYSRAVSFIAARATQRLDITDVVGQEAESGVDTIAFTAPILDSQGTFLGVVTSRVGIPFLE
ncbi:MAG: PDC sensor domain-containing protein, partial [Nitrospirota bacterium]